MNVLVFSPHPDDDLIGCGGSMAKFARNGHGVTVIYVTSGESGSLTYSKEQLVGIRETEARAAAGVMGVTDLMFMRHPDGAVVCDAESLVAVTGIIRARKPDLVYAPPADDTHRDHRATHELVVEAIRRAAGPWFQECPGEPWRVGCVLCYEVWTPLSRVSYAEDISGVMEIKLRALSEHRSQVQDIPYDEAVRGLNRYRGVMTGRGQYCECFQVEMLGRVPGC